MKTKPPKYLKKQDNSWFTDYAHAWSDTLPHLGYAMACIEVVLGNSEPARTIYKEITNTLKKPEVVIPINKSISNMSKQDKLNLENLVRYPETIIHDNPDDQLRDFEELSKTDEFDDVVLQTLETLLPDGFEYNRGAMTKTIELIGKFITVVI